MTEWDLLFWVVPFLLVGQWELPLAIGAGGLASGFGSYLGGRSQAKGAQKYIDYLNAQRGIFLTATDPIRKRLESYATGDVGYSPQVLDTMRQGVGEDYGKGLSEAGDVVRKASVSPGGVYTAGRGDRTGRLLGENITTRRAESLRDITKQNADLANSNMRYAIQAAPTYEPGLPSTPVPELGAFQAAQGPSLAGTLLQAGGQTGSQIGGQYLGAQLDPYKQLFANPSYMNMYLNRFNNWMNPSPSMQGSGGW